MPPVPMNSQQICPPQIPQASSLTRHGEAAWRSREPQVSFFAGVCGHLRQKIFLVGFVARPVQENSTLPTHCPVRPKPLPQQHLQILDGFPELSAPLTPLVPCGGT